MRPLTACVAILIALSAPRPLPDAFPQDGDATDVVLPVPSGLILELGTRYRYELEETSHSTSSDLERGKQTKKQESSAKLRWDVEMLVIDSGPEGVELAVVIKRLRGQVTSDGKTTKLDSETSTELGGVLSLVGEPTYVKLNARGHLLGVTGDALDALAPADQRDGRMLAYRASGLYRRFFQTLPEKDVPLGGTWRTMREYAAWYPPDHHWLIHDLEETRFVKSVDDGVASLVVTCRGTEKSPRRKHARGEGFKAKGTDMGSSVETRQFSGTSKVDVVTGQTVARSVRGTATVYRWHAFNGEPRWLTLSKHQHAGKLTLVEVIPPQRPTDDD